MILSVCLLPQFHGQIGLLDELELCLAPFVVVITVLVYRFLSGKPLAVGSAPGSAGVRLTPRRNKRSQPPASAAVYSCNLRNQVQSRATITGRFLRSKQ